MKSYANFNEQLDYYENLGLPKTASEQEIKKQLDFRSDQWVDLSNRAPKADTRENADRQLSYLRKMKKALLNQDARARYDLQLNHSRQAEEKAAKREADYWDAVHKNSERAKKTAEQKAEAERVATQKEKARRQQEAAERVERQRRDDQKKAERQRQAEAERKETERQAEAAKATNAKLARATNRMILTGFAIAGVLLFAIVSLDLRKPSTAIAETSETPSLTPTVTPVPEWTAWVAPGKQINVRSGPGLEFPLLSTETSGSPIVTTGGVKDTNGNSWQEVRLMSGQRGFIANWVANKSLNSFHPSALPEEVTEDAYIEANVEGADAYSPEYNGSIPYREGSVDPSSRSMNPPNYPSEERRRGVQGTSVLIVSIDANGGVDDVSVDRSSGSRILDLEAVRAARRWRFDPGIRNGRQVASRVRVPVEFRLPGRSQPWGGTVATVACFLPGGNEVRISRSDCQAQGGSVFE